MNTALLVASHEARLSEARTIAASMNFHVVSAQTADKAWEALAEWTFTLAVIDADMPGTGAELAKAVREISPETRVCLVSERPVTYEHFAHHIVLWPPESRALQDIFAQALETAPH